MARKSPKMTAKRRKTMSKKQFAVPSKRKYPIDTANRARNALARVQQHGSPSEKAKVKRAVKRKYPSIKVAGRRKGK